MIRFDVLTLFPEIIHGYRGQSILRLARERGLVEIHTHDIRDWAHDRHRSVDDRPFGGGPGMVLRPEPVVECVEAVQQQGEKPGHLILLTPQGRRFDQRRAEALAEESRLLLLCGRYEGIDQRVVELLQPEEISVGDFILGGGEVGAMVIMDATIRLVPGVLGDERSNQLDSFSGADSLISPISDEIRFGAVQLIPSARTLGWSRYWPATSCSGVPSLMFRSSLHEKLTQAGSRTVPSKSHRTVASSAFGIVSQARTSAADPSSKRRRCS